MTKEEFQKVLNVSEYEDLVSFLADLPETWYPDLLIRVVEAAYKKEVFLLGGASRLIQRIEQRIGKKG